jgi:drug/metabolite transporter (DMT)-like permease
MSDGKRPIGRLQAVVALVGFATATTIGYILYGLFFRNFSPFVLTFAMFVPVFVALCFFGLYGKRALVSRPSKLHLYALCFAFLQLTYWYAFWFSIKTLGASIAIAFISLTAFFGPLASHWHTQRSVKHMRSFVI